MNWWIRIVLYFFIEKLIHMRGTKELNHTKLIKTNIETGKLKKIQNKPKVFFVSHPFSRIFF